jgi:hypothetical protein
MAKKNVDQLEMISPKLKLYRVMSPWNSNDAEEGTYESSVWAIDEDDALSALAYLMADDSASGCDTDEEKAQWVKEHLEYTQHLMVVTSVAESIRNNIREILAGPDGDFNEEASRVYESIMEALGGRDEKTALADRPRG